MKTGILFILVTFIGINETGAQTLKKYSIPETGCSVYLYCAPDWDVDYSEDSSRVYMTQCEKNDVNYGVICIKLLHQLSDLNLAEQMLIEYMNYLKLNFEIRSSAGYGMGHRLNNNEQTRGVVDYWTDKDKNEWKVKGWTDGKFVGVLYGFSNKPLPEPKLNVFLESLRFP